MLRFAVKCPTFGTIAVFAMEGDAEEWMTFYGEKYPNMTGMLIEKETWHQYYEEDDDE